MNENSINPAIAEKFVSTTDKDTINPVSEREFTNELNDHNTIIDFRVTSKFKSINRAIKRGHVSPNGELYPKRPFNNRCNTSSVKNHHSRQLNENKKKIYFKFKSLSPVVNNGKPYIVSKIDG